MFGEDEYKQYLNRVNQGEKAPVVGTDVQTHQCKEAGPGCLVVAGAGSNLCAAMPRC